MNGRTIHRCGDCGNRVSKRDTKRCRPCDDAHRARTRIGTTHECAECGEPIDPRYKRCERCVRGQTARGRHQVPEVIAAEGSRRLLERMAVMIHRTAAERGIGLEEAIRALHQPVRSSRPMLIERYAMPTRQYGQTLAGVGSALL